MNPELRQTLNVLSHNFENANQAAQENIYSFTQLYIDPCLSGFRSCFDDCTAPCFPSRDSGARRRRGRRRSRGQAENYFDFYDDWDDEEDPVAGGQAWGNDELDSLLAGRGQQPKRQRGMSYGSKSRRRAGPMQPSDAEEDPTIIPGSSYLGFLERLPFKIGSRVLKYRPSAANLQEHPGAHRSDFESQPLLEEEGYGTIPETRGHTRQRSATQNSRSTTNSLSSRGDLILSDEEGDAVPLDDEFAVMLSRRNTNTEGADQQSSGKNSAKRLSRRSTQRTVSSKSKSSSNHSTPSKRSRSQRSRNFTSPNAVSPSIEEVVPFPSMRELRQEEEEVRQLEELEIAQKREIAQRLAVERGLSAQSDQSLKELPGVESTELGARPAVELDAVNDGSLGETRSMTDVDNITDQDADVEDLSASRDTLSSCPGPARTTSGTSLDRASRSGHSGQNEHEDPP
jgi:hypothetical protein